MHAARAPAGLRDARPTSRPPPAGQAAVGEGAVRRTPAMPRADRGGHGGGRFISNPWSPMIQPISSRDSSMSVDPLPVEHPAAGASTPACVDPRRPRGRPAPSAKMLLATTRLGAGSVLEVQAAELDADDQRDSFPAPPWRRRRPRPQGVERPVAAHEADVRAAHRRPQPELRDQVEVHAGVREARARAGDQVRHAARVDRGGIDRPPRRPHGELPELRRRTAPSEPPSSGHRLPPRPREGRTSARRGVPPGRRGARSHGSGSVSAGRGRRAGGRAPAPRR